MRILKGVLALVPLISLGLLSPIPSAVLAARSRRPTAWVAFGGFVAAWAVWITMLSIWPDGGAGIRFACSFVALLVNTVGAALHCLLTPIDRS